MFSSCFLAVQWSFLSTTSRGLLAAEQQYRCCCCCCCITSVMSNSVQPHRWQPTRLPSPWDSPGKNTGVGCHFLLQCIKVKVKSLSCVRFSNPMDYSLPGSSVHGILQARTLEWLPLPSPSTHAIANKWKDSAFSVALMYHVTNSSLNCIVSL